MSYTLSYYYGEKQPVLVRRPWWKIFGSDTIRMETRLVRRICTLSDAEGEILTGDDAEAALALLKSILPDTAQMLQLEQGRRPTPYIPTASCYADCHVETTTTNLIPNSARTYFASEADGSNDRVAAEAEGLVKPGERYYQLQKNDELGVHKTDEDAVNAALDDEARGDPYAKEQLELAKTDLLVHEMRKRREKQ